MSSEYSALSVTASLVIGSSAVVAITGLVTNVFVTFTSGSFCTVSDFSSMVLVTESASPATVEVVTDLLTSSLLTPLENTVYVVVITVVVLFFVYDIVSVFVLV